jgi:phenylpropionate dioxygenase-like ring-hydroxylating dioxygenase large terminal subunit
MAEPKRTLPSRYYTDPAVFEGEKERIFARSWLCAGRLEQLREPGDYFTCRVMDEELILLRDMAGELRAFYNVCQHRAHRLLAGAGNQRVIACPYHAWTYELDGRLRGAPNRNKVAGFDGARICLTPVQVDTLATLILVNLDPAARPLRETMAGLEEEILAYTPDPEAVTCGHSQSFELEANWKVVLENYSECYHCVTAHPSFTRGTVEPASYRIVPHGLYQSHISKAKPDETANYAFDRTATAHGDEFAGWLIWPLTAFQVYPGGYVNSFRWVPIAVDRTVLDVDWYLPRAGPTAEEREMIDLHIRTTLQEDVDLVASVQQGLRSRGYDSGPLMIDGSDTGKSEHGVLALQELVREALEA